MSHFWMLLFKMKQAHVPTGYIRKPTVYIGLITRAIWKNQSLPPPGPKEW